MDQYEMIRTAHRVYETSISEISRITGHSRKTIKRAIRGEPWGYKERAHQPFPVLEKYLPIIDGWLIGDKDSPKKQRPRRVGYTIGWWTSMGTRGASPPSAGTFGLRS